MELQKHIKSITLKTPLMCRHGGCNARLAYGERCGIEFCTIL